MLLDEIEANYPKRTADSVTIKQHGFELMFDLPKMHHLYVSVDAKDAHNGTVVVYETMREIHSLAIDDWKMKETHVPGSYHDVLPVLQECFRKAIGNAQKHFYEDSLVALIAKAYLLKEEGA